MIQIAGHRDYPLARERLDAAGRPDGFTLLEYEPDLAQALAACDLVLARAGGSVFELAAAGRPAILVPYPHAAAGHQHANAAWMAESGAALVIEDSELEPGGARARRGGALRRPGASRRDGGGRRAGSPARTPRGASPTRSSEPPAA